MTMLHARRARLRWPGALLASLCYGAAAILAPVLMSWEAARPSSWPWFFLTTAISFAFFGVGLLVWWYGRKRRVAALFLLVCTCLAFSLVLAVPSEVHDHTVVQICTSLSASLGIFLLLLLVLHFPYQVLRPWSSGGWRLRLLWLWLLWLGILSTLSACYCLSETRFPAASWFEPWYMGYYLSTVLSILGILLAQLRLPLAPRERQQLRFLLTGIALSLAPWFCCSLVPDLLHALLPRLALVPITDYGTMPALILLPLTLGYTALRYQFLVPDALVAQVVCAVIRGVALVLCVYLGLSGFLLLPHTPLWFLVSACGCTAISISIWRLSHWLTMTVLFAELRQNRALISSTLTPSGEIDNLPTLARTISHLAQVLAGSQCAWVLVRDEASGLYHLPGHTSININEGVLIVLNDLCTRRYPAPPLDEWSLAHELEGRLLQSPRPLFLQELPLRETAAKETREMVLVSLAEGNTLHGMLMLDVRGDHQPYAGANFEALSALRARVLPLLASALQQAVKTAQTSILEEGLRQTTLLGRLGPEDSTAALTALLARFLPAQVEVWEQRKEVWYRLAQDGVHSHAWSTEQSRAFLSASPLHALPLFEPGGFPDHPLPLVMLPLEEGPTLQSRLLAHYSRPSRFLPERRQMLLLASQHARRMLETARTRMVSAEERLPRAFVEALPSLEEATRAELTAQTLRHLKNDWQVLRYLGSAIAGYTPAVCL